MWLKFDYVKHDFIQMVFGVPYMLKKNLIINKNYLAVSEKLSQEIVLIISHLQDLIYK